MCSFVAERAVGGAAGGAAGLAFTGNWFIDAGILGFVNLMEEVYGWNVECLNEKIGKMKEIIYFGLFPVAYFYDWLTSRGYISSKKIPSAEEMMKKFSGLPEEDILEMAWWEYILPMFTSLWVNKKIDLILMDKFKLPDGVQERDNKEKIINNFKSSTNELLSKYQDTITKILKKRKAVKHLNYELIQELFDFLIKNEYGENEPDFLNSISIIRKKFNEVVNLLAELWLHSKELISRQNEKFFRLPVDSGFYKNFLFFNISKGLLEQKKGLLNLLKVNLDEKMLQKIDKTVNKLLPSDADFSNVLYVPLDTQSIGIPEIFVYFLCFTKAFKNTIQGKRVLFYSPSLPFTYKVNRKIHQLISSVQKKKESASLFNVTWGGIIDTVSEYKSLWALENMYLIEYRRLDNQVQEGVEYIGIPKLQAALIIDDRIRNALNRSIPLNKKRGKKPVSTWLLKEFIKGKSLLVPVISHMHLVFSEKNKNPQYIRYFANFSLITALTVDAVIKEIKATKTYSGNLFSMTYFSKYRDVVDEVKQKNSLMYYHGRLLYEMVEDKDKREKIATLLFSKIKTHDKYGFVNVILKYSVGKVESKETKDIVRYLFEQILHNDISWENYALSLVIGLIKRGDENE